MDSNVSLMITVSDFLKNDKYEVNIKNELGFTSIEFLKDRTYSIPAYQREIRWTGDNVIILMNDIACGKKFLGTILLNKVSESCYEIIDGQQRVSVFLLILNVLKSYSYNFEMCNFKNETYLSLPEVMDLDFEIEKIEKSPKKDEYLKSDILEQRERFEILYKTIKSWLDKKSPSEKTSFKDNLLFSELNIILATNSNSKIFVDYYLDLNDKSVKLDSIDILKATLFKMDFDLMSKEWANVQKSIKNLRLTGFQNYALNTLYFHYFSCTVNKYLDYKLVDLKPDLKFNKGISINNHHYEAKTSILKAVKDQEFFKCVIEQLKGIAGFLHNAYKNDGLSDIKDRMRQGGCANDTITCVFEIISLILRIDDEVPKMLVIKYYLEVLSNEHINKNDVRSIFDIYIYCVLFTLTAGKKESSKLVRVVLSNDWKNKIQEAAVKIWECSRNKINYWKKITVNGKATITSGQFLPKHVMAIKEFISLIEKKFIINQKKLKEFLTSSNCTAEHFFINESQKITFQYGPDSKIAEIKVPRSVIKYISCPVNYLYIDSQVNSDMGNVSICEKINFLKNKGKVAFSSEMSYNYFQALVELFDKKKDFPDLSLIKSRSKAASMLSNYYKNEMIELMKEYSEIIKKL